MIYRKQGSTVRWENGTLIRVTECGVAREEGPLFECFPAERSGSEGELPPDRVHAMVESVRDLDFERLIVTSGVAEHECDGRTWREETQRFHASLVRNGLRALVDRIEDVRVVAGALDRATRAERVAPGRMRLAPNVAAAMLPFHPAARQTAGGVDGYGFPVTETSESYYRPSYRVRPLRMKFNVRLDHDATEVDAGLPLAVALLAPADGLLLRVLIDDGEDVYPAAVRIGEIRAVSRERVWYPFGAGSFGAEMML